MKVVRGETPPQDPAANAQQRWAARRREMLLEDRLDRLVTVLERLVMVLERRPS